MIDLDYVFGNGLVFCDEPKCQTEDTFDGFDGGVCFENIIDEMKSAGWKITRKDGSWHHICPSCVYEMEAED